MVNTPPEMAAAEMLTLASPVFVTLILCVSVLPTGTLLKLRVADDGVSTPPVGPLPVWPVLAAPA